MESLLSISIALIFAGPIVLIIQWFLIFPLLFPTIGLRLALYSSIYIAPLNSRGPTEGLLVQLAQRKETSLRSDKDVERLDDKKAAWAEGERRFQRIGSATEKDLHLAIVNMVWVENPDYPLACYTANVSYVT